MKRIKTRWIVFAGWLLPTIAMGLWLGLTSNVVVGEADAGAFLSAESRPGGFFAPSVMTVHTTRGTLAVADFISAQRGTPLVVIDSTRDGLQVCSDTNRTLCSDLTGLYAGELEPVRHAPVWLTFERRQWLEIALIYWAVLGLGVFVLALMICADDSDPRDADAASNEPPGREPRP